MGKGGEKGGGSGEPEAQLRVYTWEEIQKHNLRTDKWLVIERKVYNVTKWANRHPGGQRVISHWAGEDATVRTQCTDIPAAASRRSAASPPCQGTAFPVLPKERASRLLLCPPNLSNTRCTPSSSPSLLLGAQRFVQMDAAPWLEP